MYNKSERKGRRSPSFTLSDNDPILKKFREGLETWERPAKTPTVLILGSTIGGIGAGAEVRITGPERTAGPERTKGGISPSEEETSLSLETPLSIDELIDQAQQEVGDIPLTIVIHGSWDEAAASFYKALVKKIPDSDQRNIWLILPEDEDITYSEELPQNILETKEKSDDGLYDNLFSDIVFITTHAKKID